MRKILFIAAGVLFISGSYAQNIDRSHAPKPGPAPVIKLKDPVVYTLKNGIKVLVVENHKTPMISASYYIYTGPVKEGDKAGAMGLMGRMLNEGTQHMSKAQFDLAAEQDGTSISLNSSGGSVAALDRYFDKGLGLMADALRYPALAQSSFDKLKTQELNGLKISEKSINTIASNVTSALAYGKQSPLGEFETSASVNNIALADVKDYYQKYITPSNGYLTIIGDIKPEQAHKLAEKYFGDWTGAKITVSQIAPVENPATTEIDLVDVPSAVQSVINVTNVISLPLDNPDYFSALIANQILGGGSDAYLFKDIREKHGFTYGAYSSVSGGVHQTRFNANAAVRNAVTDSSVMLFMQNIKKIRDGEVDQDLLRDTKAAFNGNFALGTENIARIAGFARNIMIYHLPKDYYRTYLQKINAVSATDVQKAAKKYFNYANTRIVIAGKADSIKAGLEKLGYPVKMYDKDANPVSAEAAAAANKPAASATEVINHYLKAIGGKQAIGKLTSVLASGTMKVQGMEMPITIKRMAPNKEYMEMSMNGQVVSKTIFNGTTGYQLQMGQKKDLSADQVAKYKEEKSLIPQLHYLEGDYKLVPGKVVKIDGKDANQLTVTGPSGKPSVEYYDVNTGLLLRSEVTSDMQGQSIQVQTSFSDYKKVGDLLLNQSQTMTITAPQGSQEMSIHFTDYKLNEGVSEADFQ
jgi:predicted Zn-dependent peptidase